MLLRLFCLLESTNMTNRYVKLHFTTSDRGRHCLKFRKKLNHHQLQGRPYMDCSDSEFNFWNLRIYLDIWWPLPIQDNTKQKIANISMPRAGFEPTILVFERTKTLRAAIGTSLKKKKANYRGNLLTHMQTLYFVGYFKLVTLGVFNEDA